jgi:hypothetical protein
MELNQSDRQALYNGFGNAWSLAFEIPLTVFIFGLGGWALDHWLDMFPVFSLALVVFSVAGLGVRIYYRYAAQMDAEEANAPWARK